MARYDKALQDVQARLRSAAEACGRDPAEVTLLAVSKTFPSAAVAAVHALGQREFGENYVREAAAKRAELAGLPGLRWVLIGPLQSNKTALAADVFERVESIDRLKTAQRLADARAPQRAPLDVLVQINISGEATKSGVAPDRAVALAGEVAALPRLAFCGFMGIAEPTHDPGRQRLQFAVLRHCAEHARALRLPAHTLSMGMTGDLEAAVAEGSTEVRVGTAIFGSRDPDRRTRV